MHLLDALAFVPQVQHAIVENIRTAAGMVEPQLVKPRNERIALRNHRPPPTRDLVQIFLPPNNLDHELVKGQQLPFQPQGCLM